jgi:Ser/Thr protein kinase RdoA (MazF antagonist)
MKEIIQSFGLQEKDFSIDRIGTGHIHATYKLVGPKCYVLQRVNIMVFTKPHDIASNLRAASDFLKKKHPGFLFLSTVLTVDGKEMYFDRDGYPWRLFPYIENSITVDKVDTEAEAFGAAAAFARLTCNLEGVDIDLFKPTIERFHDLPARYAQFVGSVEKSDPERLAKAKWAIELCKQFKYLVDRYDQLIGEGTLRLRITHNDTKINNILIDATSRQPICVIDLDTLMPGYFIYDVGDMVRTFVSPANEEVKDLSKVVFRKPIYDALVSGYLSEMGNILTNAEKALFPFAGMMMTYIMALRMLADFLNGDIYYHITYPEQNYVRATNQLRLLEVLSKSL